MVLPPLESWSECSASGLLEPGWLREFDFWRKGAGEAGIDSPVVAPVIELSTRIPLTREREEGERAQAGDRAALGSLLRRHGPMLYRSVLLPRLGSSAEAEEALSIVYGKVVERVHQFSWQDSGFYPWLRVIALHVAMDLLRHRKRERLFDESDLQREIDDSADKDRSTSDVSTQSPDAQYQAREDEKVARVRVEEALRQIHPRYARAIQLRVLEEKSRDEVAVALGVTPATFDVLLHRALAALRKVLGPHEE